MTKLLTFAAIFLGLICGNVAEEEQKGESMLQSLFEISKNSVQVLLNFLQNSFGKAQEPILLKFLLLQEKFKELASSGKEKWQQKKQELFGQIGNITEFLKTKQRNVTALVKAKATAAIALLQNLKNIVSRIFTSPLQNKEITSKEAADVQTTATNSTPEEAAKDQTIAPNATPEEAADVPAIAAHSTLEEASVQ